MGKKAPLTGRKPSSLKPERARKLIRKFHVLLKSQASAKADGNTQEHVRIEQEINKLGGLNTYQLASICGQSKQRGGDSSKTLVEWIRARNSSTEASDQEDRAKKSLLEIGCLQVDNACARSHLFDPHIRIDLNSQHPQIKQQDFMTMKRKQYFDIVSLSLVVNYVPDAATRGEMLIRARDFLNPSGLLFFVLPKACTDNSRYCNDSLISEIFGKIGFATLESHKTSKLVYWLLEKLPNSNQRPKPVPKRKVRDAPSMNNFAIVIE